MAYHCHDWKLYQKLGLNTQSITIVMLPSSNPFCFLLFLTPNKDLLYHKNGPKRIPPETYLLINSTASSYFIPLSIRASATRTGALRKERKRVKAWWNISHNSLSKCCICFTTLCKMLHQVWIGLNFSCNISQHFYCSLECCLMLSLFDHHSQHCWVQWCMCTTCENMFQIWQTVVILVKWLKILGQQFRKKMAAENVINYKAREICEAINTGNREAYWSFVCYWAIVSR